MASTAKSTVFVVAGIFFIFSIQGCDKISEFFDYFSPKKEQQQTQIQPQPRVSSSETQPPARPAEAPRPAPVSDKNVLVRVGGWSLTPQEFQNRLRAVKEAFPEYDINNSQQNALLLEEMVRQQLLVEAAREEGLDKNPEIEEAVKEFRKTLLVQEVARKLTEDIRVTDEEARKYYEENKELMVEPAQWRVREIVAPTEEKARALLMQLWSDSPLAFEDLAQKESIAESAWRKGDLGLIFQFPFERMENAVKALEPGGVSNVFKGPEGFYIVKLEEVKQGEPVGFEEVKEEIREGLMLLKQQDAIINRMVEMQQKVDFYINEELLQEQGL